MRSHYQSDAEIRVSFNQNQCSVNINIDRDEAFIEMNSNSLMNYEYGTQLQGQILPCLTFVNRRMETIDRTDSSQTLCTCMKDESPRHWNIYQQWGIMPICFMGNWQQAIGISYVYEYEYYRKHCHILVIVCCLIVTFTYIIMLCFDANGYIVTFYALSLDSW